jgi:cystathionine beta-synthase
MYNRGCYGSILDIIGNTPMVRLNKVVSDLHCQVFAKLEFLNPMGSSKDRIAKYLIECAEQSGQIKLDDTILESSSGNTAIGLALIAIQKGYKLKVVVRDSTSKEKLDMLKALGATVIKADTGLPPNHAKSYNNIANTFAKEEANCYFPDQHNNRDNNEAHYRSTGPEIWDQMDGQIDAFIAGIGTGGTIGGVGRYLKEKKPEIKIIAVDVEGSVFTSYFYTGKTEEPSPYLLEGLGDEFIINCADFSVIDDIIQISDKEAFHGARELVMKEGILAGGSSGAVLQAIRKVAPTLVPNARVAILFPDGASRYLGTIFNDDWMEIKGML